MSSSFSCIVIVTVDCPSLLSDLPQTTVGGFAQNYGRCLMMFSHVSVQIEHDMWLSVCYFPSDLKPCQLQELRGLKPQLALPKQGTATEFR